MADLPFGDHATLINPTTPFVVNPKCVNATSNLFGIRHVDINYERKKDLGHATFVSVLILFEKFLWYPFVWNIYLLVYIPENLNKIVYLSLMNGLIPSGPVIT